MPSPLFLPHIQRISAKRSAKYHRHITSLKRNEAWRVSRNLRRVGGLYRSPLRGILLHGTPPSISDNENAPVLFPIALSLLRESQGAAACFFFPPGRRWPEGPDEGARLPYLKTLAPLIPLPRTSPRRGEETSGDLPAISEAPNAQRLKNSPKTSICLCARTTSATSATACGTARSHTGE